MKIGWLKIESYYYYFDSSGVMQTNKTIDGYYVDSNGRRTKK
jgi:glucan-binding YG repeat protein